MKTKESFFAYVKRNYWLLILYIIPIVFFTAKALGYTAHFMYDLINKFIDIML